VSGRAAVRGGAHRRAEEERRKRRLAVRVLVFALCILAVCALRLGGGARLASLRARAEEILNSHADYEGAVETLGRAASGEQAPGEAAAVFGRMLLGLEDAP